MELLSAARYPPVPLVCCFLQEGQMDSTPQWSQGEEGGSRGPAKIPEPSQLGEGGGGGEGEQGQGLE